MQDSRRNNKGQFRAGASGNPDGVSKEEIARRANAQPDDRQDGIPRTPGTVTPTQAAAAVFAAMPPEELEARHDGWQSELYGLGSEAYDKRESARYTPTILDYQTLARLWETEAYIAKGIEAPGAEAFRTPFEIHVPGAPNDKYEGFREDLEDELRDLGVEDRLEKAYQYKRAYGGGAVLLGLNDGRPLWEPIDKSRTDLQLEYLETYEPLEIVPYEIYLDPNRPSYGSVATYRLAASAGYGPVPGATSGRSGVPPLDQTVVIHESRLIVFSGVEVSRYWRSTNLISPYWGASVVPRFYQVLRDLAVALAGVGLAMTETAQPVFSIAGLRDKLAKNENVVHSRMRALNMSRSIARAILLDADRGEKFERQQLSFAGIPEVLDRVMQYSAGAIDIPLSVLIGYSPATLGKPDSDELSLWNSQTDKRRRREFTPALRRVIKYVIPRIRKRKIPPRYQVLWCPLERITQKDEIEMDRVQAETDVLVVKGGMATSDEMRKARYTRSGYSRRTYLDPETEAPGFVAPLPAGVMPKASPAMKVIEGEEMEAAQGETGASAKPPKGGKGGAGGAKPGPGADAHAVAGYVRKNPAAPAGGVAAGIKGGRPKKDAAEESATEADHASVQAKQIGVPSAGAVGDEGSEADRVERVGDLTEAKRSEKVRRALRDLHDEKHCDARTCPFCGPPPHDPDDRYVRNQPDERAEESASDVKSNPARGDSRVAPYEAEQPDDAQGHTTTMPRAAAPVEGREEPSNEQINPPFPSPLAAQRNATYEPPIPTVETDAKEDATAPGLAQAIAARGPETTRTDRIRKEGDEYVVESGDGKRKFGSYGSRRAAMRRLAEVEMFKAMKARKDEDVASSSTLRTWGPLLICIENPAGSQRFWEDTDGSIGSTTMLHDYGFVLGARGADGDFLDVFVGPEPFDESPVVYVIAQMTKRSDFTEYDEDKVMVGFPSLQAAEDAYLAHYDDPRFMGSTSPIHANAWAEVLSKVVSVD